MGDPTALDALGRMLPALALIIGALLFVRRWAQRNHKGGSHERLRVLGRTSLTRSSSLAVVQVGERRFLVGAAEQSVTLLSELDPGDEPGITEQPGRPVSGTLHTAATDRRAVTHPDRPRTGLVDRLRLMTVRSHLEGPIRVTRE